MPRLCHRLFVALLFGLVYNLFVTPFAPAYASGLSLGHIDPDSALQSCSDNVEDSVAWLNTYNLTVLEDLIKSQEVQGRVFVGRDFRMYDSTQFGTRISSIPNSCNGKILTVVHDIFNGNALNINAGGVQYGNSKSDRSFNFNGSQGCTASQNTQLTAAFTANVVTEMQTFSAHLKDLPANNPDPTRIDQNRLNFYINTVTANGLAVFDVTADQVFTPNAGGTIEMIASVPVTTVVLNVSGQTINWNNAQLGNFFKNNVSKIIWNFYQATSLNFQPEHFGALLAPNATLTTNSGVNGSTVVKTVQNLGYARVPTFGMDNTGGLDEGCEPPPEYDFGDAPSSYGTLSAGNGPSHLKSASNTLRLGTVIDFEGDGLPGINANGDNTSNLNDEEGIASFPTLLVSATSYQVSVRCSSSGVIAGWIDFNRNGAYEGGERTQSNCNSATVALTWNNLTGLVAGVTYARFRIATNGSEIANPTGLANDGEVEDYLLTINSLPRLVKAFSPSFITSGEASGLFFVISNFAPTSIDHTGLGFTDNLPSGLRLTDPLDILVPQAFCGDPTVNATPGGTSISFSNISVSDHSSCAIRVKVTNAPGQLNPDCGNLPAAFTNGRSNISGVLGTLDASALTSSCLLVLQPQIVATKVDSLLVDADGDEKASPGDTLRYTVNIANSGTGTAFDVSYTDAPDLHTQLITGSVTTTAGAIVSGNGVTDTTVSVDIGDLASGNSVMVTLDVRIKTPLPNHVTYVSNQGSVTVQNLDVPSTVTDDPRTDQPDDPTVTPIQAAPRLRAEKRSVHFEDVNQDGIINPGDRLLFEIRIVNLGNTSATGVTYVDIPHTNTRLIPGSVGTTQGTVLHGNIPGDTRIEVAIGEIPGGESEVLIGYQVSVNNPLRGLVPVEIWNQGIVQTDDPNAPLIPTDDPDTPEIDDPTRNIVMASPDFQSTKRASLITDLNGDSKVSSGDTILYTVLVANRGNTSGTQVVYTDTIDPNTDLVPGSVQSSQGTILSGNSPNDRHVEIALGTIYGAGGQVEISYRVTIRSNIPESVVEIVNQGRVRDGRPEIPEGVTDDPDTPQRDDPTRVPIGAGAQLRTYKRDILLDDLDRSFTATPDDIIVYLISIENDGSDDALNVVFTDPPDAHTSLVVGSVTSSLGTITSGNNVGDTTVSVNIGVFPVGAIVNIAFNVSINPGLPSGLTVVSNQGMVSSNNNVTPCPIMDTRTVRATCPQMPTGDPDTTEPFDPTLTEVFTEPTSERPVEQPQQRSTIMLPLLKSPSQP